MATSFEVRDYETFLLPSSFLIFLVLGLAFIITKTNFIVLHCNLQYILERRNNTKSRSALWCIIIILHASFLYVMEIMSSMSLFSYLYMIYNINMVYKSLPICNKNSRTERLKYYNIRTVIWIFIHFSYYLIYSFKD